jgi:hypothetical protein
VKYFKLPNFYLLFQTALLTAGYYKVPNSEIVPVAAVFYKLLRVLKKEYKPIYVIKANYDKIGMPRVVVGYALHSTSSFIKHACDATMFQVNYGSTFVYRARKPIKKGEQLTDCFYQSAMNAPRDVRQKFFMGFFGHPCK